MRIHRFAIGTILGLVPLLAVNSATLKQPFSLSLKPVQATVKMGSEVRIEVTLRNVSDQQIGILRSDGEGDYAVEVRDSQGKMAPDTDFGRKLKDPAKVRVSTATPLYPLKPQEVLKDEITVNELYEMSSPGKYAISVARTIPEELGGGVAKSNAVTVTITP